jgi:hypothetical protein
MNPISQKAGRAGRGLGFLGVVRSSTGLETSSKPMLVWVEGHGCFEVPHGHALFGSGNTFAAKEHQVSEPSL